MSAERPPVPIADRLLPELISEIIDVVHFQTEDRHSRYRCLSSCALVCKAFLSHSQRRLFSRIVLPARLGSRQLEDGDHTSRLASLLEIIENNPSLAEHIKELHLVLPNSDPSWMHDNLQLRTIMRKINSTKVPVQKLQLISTSTMARFKIPDSASYLQLIDFFGQAFAPYITTLRVEFISDVPLEMLAMCANLRNLTLLFVTVRRWSPDWRQPDSPPPKIEHLEYNLIDAPPGLSRALLAGDSVAVFDFSRLRSLTTYADDSVKDLDLAQKIIDCTAPDSLQNIVVKMSPREQILSVPSTILNLEQHRNLDSLTTVAFFKTPGRDGLSETCITLKSINTTRLKRIHVIMCVNANAHVLLRAADWKTFVSEVLRVSGSDIDERRANQMELFLDVHYYAPSEWVPKPWKSPKMGPKGYIEGVLDKLVAGRLALLKNCSRIDLKWCVTVVDYPDN